MNVEYIGLKAIEGPLVVLEGIKDATSEEIVEIYSNGITRLGKVIEIKENACIVQVFEGTKDLSLTNTRTKFTGHPMMMPLSEEILGRILNGTGKPIDGLGDIYAEEKRDINGMPLNPASRKYPRDYIQTGISSIDGLTTLIRGQKLPIFSGNGLPHNQLVAQIVKQAKIAGDNFAVVFVAMGVKFDVAEYFKRSFRESGVLEKVVMLLNLANDPVVERIITPRCGLTIAEYLAFQLNMHVLVIMTDMTSYAEALREISSSKNEIPSRKGFPGYLYSDLASLYERAGMLKGKEGSITQIPVLTMPNDDITHPVPDLTAYITEGQVVLGRELFQRGIYPPITILPSLSRLMKDGIGEGYTRKDHPDLSNQLFASYARVQEIKALASVIGEDELSDIDKKFIIFGKNFEAQFISQKQDEERDIDATLDLGWMLLGLLPKEELDRLSKELIDEYYKEINEDTLQFKGF